MSPKAERASSRTHLLPGIVLGIAEAEDQSVCGCRRQDRALDRSYPALPMVWVWSSRERNTLTQVGLRVSVLLDPGSFLLALCLSKITEKYNKREPLTQLRSTKSCQGRETRSPRVAPDLPLDPILS